MTIGNYKTKNKKYNFQPHVSVIVPARNEEKTILHCLLSLSKLKYPQPKLEIIIVNDRSTDSTGIIIDKFIKKYPTFKYIHITGFQLFTKTKKYSHEFGRF